MDQPNKAMNKRYAAAAIIFGGSAVAGAGALAYQDSKQSNRPSGVPISHNGQRYYVPEGSRRAVYPTKQECLADVPADRQQECEPTRNYGGGPGYYGPLYRVGDGGYRPSGRYGSEPADGRNTGKTLPKSASSSGFGSTGKSGDGSGGSGS